MMVAVPNVHRRRLFVQVAWVGYLSRGRSCLHDTDRGVLAAPRLGPETRYIHVLGSQGRRDPDGLMGRQYLFWVLLE